VAEASEPWQAGLQAFHRKNSGRFSASGWTSCDHVYLNTDQHGRDAAADARCLSFALNADPESVDLETTADRFRFAYRVDPPLSEQTRDAAQAWIETWGVGGDQRILERSRYFALLRDVFPYEKSIASLDPYEMR